VYRLATAADSCKQPAADLLYGQVVQAAALQQNLLLQKQALLHARLLIIPATLSWPRTLPLNLMLNTKKAPESRASTQTQTALAHVL
jgi:hypothetical protein